LLPVSRQCLLTGSVQVPVPWWSGLRPLLCLEEKEEGRSLAVNAASGDAPRMVAIRGDGGQPMRAIRTHERREGYMFKRRGIFALFVTAALALVVALPAMAATVLPASFAGKGIGAGTGSVTGGGTPPTIQARGADY